MGFEKPGEEEFRIPVSDTQAYRQFGNAVVVPVVRAVAQLMKPHVMEVLTKEGRAVPCTTDRIPISGSGFHQLKHAGRYGNARDPEPDDGSDQGWRHETGACCQVGLARSGLPVPAAPQRLARNARYCFSPIPGGHSSPWLFLAWP